MLLGRCVSQDFIFRSRPVEAGMFNVSALVEHSNKTRSNTKQPWILASSSPIQYFPNLWSLASRHTCWFVQRKLTIQISWDTSSIQASRCHSKRAAKVNYKLVSVTHWHCWKSMALPMLAMVPPCMILRRFWFSNQWHCWRFESESFLTVCSLRTSSSNSTRPGSAAVTLS